MTARQAHIVVDLGFGDSGKGTLTDALVRRTGADLVVRFNGGAQAGHTVVTDDGQVHTFSQLGAGTFVPGVRSHLSRHTLVHPGGLLEEARVLGEKGVEDALERLSISPQALIITPFQQAANRLREIGRGQGRHGSCGLGIGETAEDALLHPEEAIRAADLLHPASLLPRLLRLQQRKWQTFAARRRDLVRHPQGSLEIAVLESAEAIPRWLEGVARLVRAVKIEEARFEGSVIFEGAQGVLLDEWRGFHPHTTWSTCTHQNALELLHGWDGEVVKWGVTRSYSTRHGAGPFPTEDAGLALSEPHNAVGPWQGGFRQGWLDLVLLRYAARACGGLDALAVTHLDRVEDGWKVCDDHRGYDENEFRDESGLKLGPPQDLGYQERLGQALAQAEPHYRQVTAASLLTLLEQTLEAPVALESRGARFGDKRFAGVKLNK